MPWSVVVEDQTFDLEDLDLDWFQEIADADGRAGPFAMAISPTYDARRMWLILAKCCKDASTEPPDEPEKNSAREVKRLITYFRYTDDEIEDAVMIDGFPPTPDVPETGSGSGAPGDTDGRQPSPARRKSRSS